MEWFTLAFLGTGFLIQVLFRNFRGRLRRAFCGFCVGAILFVAVTYLFLTYFQYVEWSNPAGITKYLLPPYKQAGYVFGYHLTRFLIYYFISFLASFSFIVLALGMNKKFGGRFFEPEEPFMGALSIFVLGDPRWNYAWIYYLSALFGLYLVFHLTAFARSKLKRIALHADPNANRREIRDDSGRSALYPRLPMYWLWLPTALGVIIVRGLTT